HCRPHHGYDFCWCPGTRGPFFLKNFPSYAKRSFRISGQHSAFSIQPAQHPRVWSVIVASQVRCFYLFMASRSELIPRQHSGIAKEQYLIMKDFRDLKVWEKAHTLVIGCYTATGGVSKKEMFGFVLMVVCFSFSL